MCELGLSNIIKSLAGPSVVKVQAEDFFFALSSLTVAAMVAQRLHKRPQAETTASPNAKRVTQHHS